METFSYISHDRYVDGEKREQPREAEKTYLSEKAQTWKRSTGNEWRCPHKGKSQRGPGKLSTPTSLNRCRAAQLKLGT